jgi:nucleoid-associated protein YgaU
MSIRWWGRHSDPPVPRGTYLVQPGDNLWTIAWRTYGNPNWWYEVFRANRRLLSFRDVVNPGMTIRLPALS